MAKRSSSRRWQDRQRRDQYVKRAHEEGYRSRAAYKLKELDDKDRILKRGMIVVDLGAAPGGWTQVAVERVGPEGRVIGLDILPMPDVPGAEFIQGDFTEQEVFDSVMERLPERSVGLVLSDMAPNITGERSVDQPRSMYLVELAVDFAVHVLRPGGDALMKVFQGEGFDALRSDLQRHFGKVTVRKPDASRADSREVYVLARNYIL